MKTTLTALICLILAGKTYSQEYYPLVVEDNTWNVLSVTVLVPPFDVVYSTVTYKISGDTIISSKAYKKTYYSWEEIPSNWSLWGYMREDTNRKVWMRPDWVSQELLGYDFSVSTGDTILAGIEEPVQLFVDSITIININGTDRRKFWLSYVVSPDIKETWIEGIGSDKGIVWSGSGFMVGGWYELLCLSNNGEQIYMNPEHDFCYINTVGIGEDAAESFQIFPVPAGDNLKINNLNDIEIYSISIIDFSGKIIRVFDSSLKIIDLSALKSGIYFLKIDNENGEIVQKFVKM